jgi:hypothetical protein
MFSASDFFTRYGVRRTAAPIAFYDREYSEPGGLTHRRMVWGLVLCRDEDGGNSQRVLRFTMETGTSSTVGEVFDWEDNLPGIVSDVGYGALPFDEFVVEGHDGHCSDPIEAYDIWLAHVTLRRQVEAWLRGNTKLREDFYRIGTD